MKKGSHHTIEARIKNSLAHKGKGLSDGRKAAISARLKGNKYALGHHPTDETRAKMSAAKRGEKHPYYNKHHSLEARAKMSAAKKGEKSPTYGKPSPFKNHHHTTESKAKIAAAFRGKRRPEETLRKIMLANLIKPNKQELKLQSLLNNHFPGEWKFVGDGQLIIGGLCPDFANVNHKKAVLELFGRYWHQKRTRWNYNELGRIMAFNSYGFRCLVIWQQELENEENVVSKVEQFMKRGKR